MHEATAPTKRQKQDLTERLGRAIDSKTNLINIMLEQNSLKPRKEKP
jgi:hypothetical protein